MVGKDMGRACARLSCPALKLSAYCTHIQVPAQPDGTCRHILGDLARAPFSLVAVGFDQEIFWANQVLCRKFADKLQPGKSLIN